MKSDFKKNCCGYAEADSEPPRFTEKDPKYSPDLSQHFAGQCAGSKICGSTVIGKGQRETCGNRKENFPWQGRLQADNWRHSVASGIAGAADR